MLKANRDKVLIRTAWVSAIGNAILSAAKISVGLLAGSLAVLDDGIDSAADVAISVVIILMARVMSRSPSKKYAFGYEKAESIATKILSLLIFYAGVQMLISSLKFMFSAQEREMPGIMAIYVTVFSILGKLFLAVYQYRKGNKINSSILKANAVNMRNDVMISAGVLVGLALVFLLKLPILDPIIGLIISVIIIKSAVSIFMESNVELMDGVKDESVYDRIFQAVEMVPGAANPHRVRTRMAGGLYIISLDVETDGKITLNQAHSIAEEVEKKIKESIPNVYDIVVHVEPAGKCHEQEKFGVDKKMLNT